MFLRQQIDRASTSIIQNTAEGADRYSRKDKKNFYIIARGSVHGCVSVLRILKIKKEITESLFNELYNDFEEISKMLSGLINSMLSE